MKKILSAALVLCLLAGTRIYAAGPFSDVSEEDWFCPYVSDALDKGILAGYPDGSFKPDRTVSYGEFLAMAMRGRGSDLPEEGHWARRFYAAASQSGVIEEAVISSRLLDAPIPRRDMAYVMAGLLRTAGLSGADIPVASGIYGDVSQTDSREYCIALCSHYGVLGGYPDGNFRPLGFLRRSEAAAAMTALAEVLDAAAAQQEGALPAEGVPAESDGPDTREELLAYEGPYYSRIKDERVLRLMSDVERDYIQTVLSSVKFTGSAGSYRVKFSWPDRPQGTAGGSPGDGAASGEDLGGRDRYSVKMDVHISDKRGVGITGYLWQMRRGLEETRSYYPQLQEAGSLEWKFDIKSANNVGYISFSVVVIDELLGEAAMGMYRMEPGDSGPLFTAQYKLSSASYRVSGTFALDGPKVFMWQ